MMEVTITFDDIVDAFEQSRVDQHYFIDPQKNEIIYISDDNGDNSQETLDALDSSRVIAFPVRLPREEFLIMEQFVYMLEEEEDVERVEAFINALGERHPFSAFKGVLYAFPELRERWFRFRDRLIRNEAINWLCANDIELPGQQLISAVEIRELTEKEVQNLPKEMEGFGPVACLVCHNKKGLKARFFSINVSPENELIEKETKRIMKEKFNVTSYGHFSGGEEELLTASRCPKCGSEKMFWDY